MAAPRNQRYILDVARLRPGFHRRRVERDGVGFEAFVWRGGPGPVLLVNAGTHGDEYEGPTILRQWAGSWRPARLRGALVAIPVLNEPAFLAGQRCNPADGCNLARSFPGRRRGRPTSRLAALFDAEILAQATHYIDLHSAGVPYELTPWAGYISGMGGEVERVQRAMTACFDHFWCWAGGYLPGRTLSAAHDRGIPAIYSECRGCGGVDPADLRGLDRGLRSVLRLLGMVPGPARRLRPQPSRITDDADETHLQLHHPAPHDGLFIPGAALGRKLRRGAAIGLVMALDGRAPTPVRAARAGRVVMVRRQRSVRRGDALAVLAPV